VKRILLILLLLALALSAWAAPKYKLLLVNTATTAWPAGFEKEGGYASFQEKVVGDFMARNPNIEVTMVSRDVTKGSLTVDALMAKGTPPDVWLDAAGWINKYLVGAYALPLEKYMDVSGFQKALVDPYTREGHVYALPSAHSATGMAVNLDMLKKIGYTLPAQKDWTTDEFLRLSERLKAAGIPSTMIMTKDGMISWNMPWLFAFGAQLYKDFDHSKVTINSPEARRGLEYMKLLVDKGYAYPNPNEQNDDMGVDLFTTGKVFSCLMQNGHTDYWVPEQVKQGRLDKPFELTFIEFPHAPGVAHAPVSGYQTIVVAHKSKDEERNKAVIELFKTQVDRTYQEYGAWTGGSFLTLVGVESPNKGMSAKDSYKAIAKLAISAGVMDLGALEPRAAEVSKEWTLPIQDFMAGRITAQQVLDRFEAGAQRVLDRK
jgi:multiple sugar transport system substrate-binding protein